VLARGSPMNPAGGADEGWARKPPKTGEEARGEGNTPGSYPYYPYYVIKFGQRSGSSLSSSLNYVIKIFGKDVLLSNYNAIAQLPMLATVSSLV